MRQINIPIRTYRNINYFERTFVIADESKITTVELLKLISEFKIIGKQIHDCSIVATMLCNDIPTILTHNTDDFKKYHKLIKTVSLT